MNVNLAMVYCSFCDTCSLQKHFKVLEWRGRQDFATLVHNNVFENYALSSRQIVQQKN